MAKYSGLYWQDIPSVIEAKDGPATHTVQLSPRTPAMIAATAMRQGPAGTAAYLEPWRRGTRVVRDGSAEQVANAVKEELEAQYDALKAAALGKR